MKQESPNTGRIDRDITHKGKPLFGYFIAPTRDGIVFGFKSKKLRDVYLTLFWKEGKIRTHITDKTKPEGPSRVPWGQQFTPDILVKKVERIVRRMVRPEPYHPLRKAWVLKRNLSRKVLEIGDASIERGTIPMEFYNKLEDPSSWIRVPIRTLIGKAHIALIEDNRGLRLVIPIDNKQMLSIGVRQHMMIQKLVAREYGFDRYMDYIQPRVEVQGPRL